MSEAGAGGAAVEVAVAVAVACTASVAVMRTATGSAARSVGGGADCVGACAKDADAVGAEALEAEHPLSISSMDTSAASLVMCDCNLLHKHTLSRTIALGWFGQTLVYR